MGRRVRTPVDLTRYRGIVPDWGRFMAAAVRPEPTVFRVRGRRIAEADLLARLGSAGYVTRPIEGLPSFFVVEDGPRPLSHSLEHWSGLLYVQQASTGVAAPALGARPGERVLDLCSSPGGKAAHLAELMQDDGCLVACEIDERRMRGLLGNFNRLGVPNVLVVAGDGRALPGGALFDRVLVDAPCSGEGTLRRRAGEPPDQSKAFLAYVTRAQRGLLERAVRLTRPGGTILYVTCTFAPEENEAIVSAALAGGAVDLEPLDLAVPHAPGVTAFEGAVYDPRLEGAARIYPHDLDSGGLFLAKLRRLDGDLPAPARDEGWSSVPAAFPGDALAEDIARRIVAEATGAVLSRHAIAEESLEGLGWILRGDTIWLHACGEWPLLSWEPGKWRAVSVGLRAIEIDTRGRPRPTNDFLRFVSSHLHAGVSDVTEDGLLGLLRGAAAPGGDMERLGPVALRLGGEVVGRGHNTRAGLVSEIPKARAADLVRALART